MRSEEAVVRKQEKMKLYEDKKRFIESEIENIKNKLDYNLDQLPNEELPFMESHLRALYFETYFLLAEGFYNASLVLCGILLENLLKEKLFNEHISDEDLENMNFGQAISKARTLKILKDDELKFLEEKKETIRNPYAHYNKMKLSRGVYFPMWEIENPVEKLIELDRRVKSMELTESQARQELIRGKNPELMSSKEFRPIAHLAKNKLEEEGFALSMFLEVDNFTRKFAENYFKPKNE